MEIPARPAQVDGGRVDGRVSVRYEDAAQDGRLTVVGIPHCLGDVVWPAVMADAGAAASYAAGVVPILARMVVHGGEGPISVLSALRGDGAWHRSAVRSADGSVERLLLSMWVDVHGRRGHVYAPADPSSPELLAGRIYAEHVLTRLFAGPADRRVLALPGGGVPEDVRPWRRFEEVAADRGEALPDSAIRFGLAHTDANQHVNSLVYPRLLEDTLLRLVPGLGLGRRCEIMWRKPFFAGDVATIRLWRATDGFSAAFADDAGAERCRIQLAFE